MHHSWFHSNQPWKHLQARALVADQATEINPSQRRTEHEERNTRTCNLFRLFKSLSFGTELHPVFYIFKRRARRTASTRRTENTPTLQPPPRAGRKKTSLSSPTGSRTPPVPISPSMETAIEGL